MELICRFYVNGELVEETCTPDTDASFKKAITKKKRYIAKFRNEYPLNISQSSTGFETEIVLHNPVTHKCLDFFVEVRHKTGLLDANGSMVFIDDYLVPKSVFDDVKHRRSTISEIEEQLFCMGGSTKYGTYLRSINRRGWVSDIENPTQDTLSDYIRIDKFKLDVCDGKNIDKIILKN